MLRNCPKATQEEKDRLYSQKFPDHPLSKNSTSNMTSTGQSRHPSPPTTHNRTQQANSGTRSQGNSRRSNNRPPRRTQRSRRAAATWAQSIRVHSVNATSDQPRHYANAAQAPKMKRPQESTCHTLVNLNEQPGEEEPVTYITEWLIDSGASEHFTPYFTDFIGPTRMSKCNVEVATGVLVPGKSVGTVKIRITDIKTHETCYVLLNNVIHVPGLNRRLISVHQWNLSGGNI